MNQLSLRREGSLRTPRLGVSWTVEEGVVEGGRVDCGRAEGARVDDGRESIYWDVRFVGELGAGE